MFVGGRPKRYHAPLPQDFAHPYLVNPAPISIVDNTDENEEEQYEEMDEDEDEEDGSSTLDATPILTVELQEVEYADMRETFSTASPRCAVCGRNPTPKTRLLKWPEDEQLRRSWLSFFRLGMDSLENCRVPYICNTHFDANQFLYEGNRIFWKRDPFPRYRQRRNILAEPFPWELEQNLERKHPSEKFSCVRSKHGAVHGHKVTFRESYSKSKSKSSHPVAVVSLPENPNIFYEFSYTRTSSIDSSKFYSCLTCRRAKTDTRMKDVIRTIHIKDGTIQSRGDPFWGHHFACRPFTSLLVDLPPAISSAMRPDYVEYNVADEEFLSEELGPGSHWEEETAPIDQAPLIGAATKVSELSNKKKEDKRRIRASPQCHLCCRVLPTTHLLVQHLLKHIKSAPKCHRCRSKISPDDPMRLQRRRICSSCHRNSPK